MNTEANLKLIERLMRIEELEGCLECSWGWDIVNNRSSYEQYYIFTPEELKRYEMIGKILSFM